MGGGPAEGSCMAERFAGCVWGLSVRSSFWPLEAAARSTVTPRLHAVDAKEFFNRSQRVDREMAQLLNTSHENRTRIFNQKCREKSEFVPGDLVWFLRPPTHATDKLLSWWLGPCPVVERLGGSSYRIEVRPGFFMNTHRSQLKPCFYDKDVLVPALHQFRLTPEDERELVEGQAEEGSTAASSSSREIRLSGLQSENIPGKNPIDGKARLPEPTSTPTSAEAQPELLHPRTPSALLHPLPTAVQQQS